MHYKQEHLYYLVLNNRHETNLPEIRKQHLKFTFYKKNYKKNNDIINIDKKSLVQVKHVILAHIK